MNKTVRQISIVGAVVLLAGFIFLSQKLSQSEPLETRMNNPLKQAPVVGVEKVENTTIPFSIPVEGRLVAYDKIDLFSEVNGALLKSNHPFKEGAHYQKGDLILKIDDQEAQLSLRAQKSALLNALTQFMPDLKIDYPESFPNWKNYLDTYNLETPLPPFPDPVSNQEKLFIASRNVLNQYYSIKSMEARLDKYSIYAPFSGVITEALIHPGAIVRANQKLGVLMNTNVYELEATLPVRELKYIRVGNNVTVSSEDMDKEWTGTVKRINNLIDPATQTATLYIGLSGSDLREGMYLKGQVLSGMLEEAFKLNRDLLVDQKYVFLLKDSVLERTPVVIERMEGNYALVKGLPEGALLLTNRIPNAYNGMRVRKK